MEEFNDLIDLHRSRSNDDSQSPALKTSLSLIAADDAALPYQTPTALTFWSNVCQLLSTREPSSDLFWTAVSIFEHAIKWAQLRRFLVHTMHTVPLLAELILRCTKSPATQQHRLLLVLDRLCAEEYRNAGDGPVFFPLVRQLLKFLHAQTIDMKAAELALSVLASLCDRNASVLMHLLHQEQPGSLATAMQELPVQSARMHIVLTRHTSTVTGKVGAKISDSLPNVMKCMCTQMQQITSTKDTHSIQHLRLLADDLYKALGKRRANDELTADVVHSFNIVLPGVLQLQSTCTTSSADYDRLDALLQLCSSIVQLTGPALGVHYNELTNLIIAHLEGMNTQSPIAAISTATAFDVLRTIVTNGPSVASVFSGPLLGLLRQRLEDLQVTSAGDTLASVALLRLIDACVDAVPTTVADLIAADAFSMLWKPLEEHRITPYRLDASELQAYVLALYVMHRCSVFEPENEARSEALRQLLSKRPVLCLLMLASRSTESNILRLGYSIMRSSHFFVDAFANIQADSNQRWYVGSLAPANLQPGITTDLRYPASCCAIAAPHAARLQQLLDKVQATLDQRRNGGGSQQQPNVSDTLIIDLYRHKVRDAEQREHRLLHSHEAALRSIIQLQHALEQQSAVLSAFEANVFEKMATTEALRSENHIMHSEHIELASTLKILQDRLDRLQQRGDQERRELANRLKISETEIQTYKKQIETECQKVEAEEKRRLRDAKEHSKKIELLTQSISKYEARVAESEERMRKTGEKYTAELASLRTALSAKDLALMQLEAQLAEKRTALERVTAENEENIKLRDAIMKMIQSKTS